MITSNVWAAVLLAEGFLDNVIVKGLAVAGGAAVGGLLTGAVGKVATRGLTTRPMPLWGVRVLRLFGGVASGWLVYFFLILGGGSGGGNGTGSGDSGTTRAQKDVHKVEQPPPKDEKKTPAKPPATGPLRIEVLGPDALKVLKQPESITYRYRAVGDEGQHLYDFKGITQVVGQRQKDPMLQVIIVLYLDSPVAGRPMVADLVNWLKDRDIKVEIRMPDEYSPEVKRSRG